MQKNMIKAIGVFTLVLFVLSVTGAAACSGSSCKACTTCKAKADSISLSAAKNCGNVLKNDTGKNIKVASVSKCANGGKVSMKSNGAFCYKPSSCSKTGTVRDSFTYKIKNSCGQTSTAKVTITYKCK